MRYKEELVLTVQATFINERYADEEEYADQELLEEAVRSRAKEYVHIVLGKDPDDNKIKVQRFLHPEPEGIETFRGRFLERFPDAPCSGPNSETPGVPRACRNDIFGWERGCPFADAKKDEPLATIYKPDVCSRCWDEAIPGTNKME